MSEILAYLKSAVENSASDMIITEGSPPVYRIVGKLRPMDAPPFSAEQCQHLLYALLNEDQIQCFEKNWELDFAVTVENRHRFRGNLYLKRGAVTGVFRTIPDRVPSLDELRLPPILNDLATRSQGLVLVTGPTGHGKSTTQAAMIDLINNTRACHIITVEEPIEYVHRHKQSVVDQREVGFDTKSFSTALKHVLRQDPDVILIGELRDLETISTALTAAETGHLVFATLHTNDAMQSIDRIVDVFPPHQQNQVRMQLSFVLLAIISQRLLPNIDETGRVCATEILLNTPAVANLIREGKNQQISSVMETQSQLGMNTMDASLKKLYYAGEIDYETAITNMKNPTTMKK